MAEVFGHFEHRPMPHSVVVEHATGSSRVDSTGTMDSTSIRISGIPYGSFATLIPYGSLQILCESTSH